jgi:hypothetical protein
MKTALHRAADVQVRKVRRLRGRERVQEDAPEFAAGNQAAVLHLIGQRPGSDAWRFLSTPSRVLGLQRAVGNAAVQRLLAERPTQLPGVARISIFGEKTPQQPVVVFLQHPCRRADDAQRIDAREQ